MRIRLTELKRIIRSEVRRALHEADDTQALVDQGIDPEVLADLEAAIASAPPEQLQKALNKLGQLEEAKNFNYYSNSLREAYVTDRGGPGNTAMSAMLIIPLLAGFGFDVDPISASAMGLAGGAFAAWLHQKLDDAIAAAKKEKSDAEPKFGVGYGPHR